MLFMPRKLPFIVALLSVFALNTQEPAFAKDNRPDYPWAPNVPFALDANQRRHHIIPLPELVNYGRHLFPSDATGKDQKKVEDDLYKFLGKYKGISKANLGRFGAPAGRDNDSAHYRLLARAYASNEGDAIEVMETLFAWLRGGLVIGPADRADPGSKFDTIAYKCRLEYSSVKEKKDYDRLYDRWYNEKEKSRVFELLAQSDTFGKVTAQSRGQCSW